MKKILAVDDSDVNLYLIQTLFEEEKDIEIITENDSANALQQLQNHLPDLLILDLMMPNLNGFELIELIKKDKSLAKTKIVIISAHLTKTTMQKIKNYQIDHIFNKPLDLITTKESILNIINE